MNIKENSYKILRFECDKYGLPLHDISDEDVQNAYIEMLQNIFIGLQPITNLTREEKVERARKYKDFLDEQLEGKDMQTKVKLMELMLSNNDYINKASYKYVKNAFESINTETKRKQYINDLREAANLPLIEALDKYSIPVSYIDSDTKDITYGDLDYNSIALSILWINENLRLFAEDEYKCKKITEKERVSDIQTKATLENSYIYKCSLMTRKDKNDEEWISKQFYIGKNTIEKLKSLNVNSQERARLLSGIVTAFKEAVKKGTTYVGEIEDTDNGITCTIDDKMLHKVEKLNRRLNTKETNKKETRKSFNGESR